MFGRALRFTKYLHASNLEGKTNKQGIDGKMASVWGQIKLEPIIESTQLFSMG